MNLSQLSAPFPPDEIEWRIGSTNKEKSKGLALAYITSRHVMDRLDSVVGIENWKDRYEVHGPRVICYLSIRINDEWVTKADGAGDTHVEAEKGGLSDALKRAAVKWGIGRYLYDLGNVWVNCEPRGKSAVISQGQEGKLTAALNQLSNAAQTQKPQQLEPQNNVHDAKAAREQKWVSSREPGARFSAEDSRTMLATLKLGLSNCDIPDDVKSFTSANQTEIFGLVDQDFVAFCYAVHEAKDRVGSKAA